MLFKKTVAIPADKCGVWLIRVFHLYKGFSRKCSYTGDFVKVSVRKVKPENWVKKKTKLRSIILRSKKSVFRNDCSSILFFFNNVVLLKKRMTPKGGSIFGPSTKSIKRKKFIYSLAGLI